MAKSHTAFVVAHADPNRILLGHVLNLPVDDLLRLDQGDGCIDIIERNGTPANPAREPCHHG